MLNFRSIKVNLILNGFAQANLRYNILVSILKDKKKDYFNGLGKTASTIKDHINSSFNLISKEITPSEIWIIY